MTIQKRLSILPEYDEKKGCFLGYAVKQGNQFLKNTKGEKIILSVQMNKAGISFVSYQDYIWELTPNNYEKHEESQLKFTPKTKNNVFQGYSIEQYDEKEGIFVPRGTLSRIDVKYKRSNPGFIDCIYEDEQTDGSKKYYFIQQISQEEYEERKQ